MSELNLTGSQREAVESRGSAILVSAAAGSGKTRVLVERLMSYIEDKDNPKDIDSFLIITYTKAAAAELRSRIQEEVGRRIAASPEDRHLIKQSNLCYRAQIGTIHSYCTSLLRENPHLADVPADFKVIDEDRAQVIREAALERLLDLAYEHMEDSPGFRLLVDTVGAGRNDARLMKVILSLHGRMQSHPYPEEWADKQIRAMDLSGQDICKSVWGQELMESAKETADYWICALYALISDIYSNEETNSPIIDAYGASFMLSAEELQKFRLALDKGWDEARQCLPITFARLKSLRNFENTELSDRVKARREDCKKAAAELAAMFSASSKELTDDMTYTRPAMEALLRLALDFDDVYEKEKRRLGYLDFSDLEHYTLKLLLDKKTGLKTQLASELGERYTEIMVDEYQDVNAVQELILNCVSNKEQNLIMVGDVKQSVYRFRLADPGIFIRKYLKYKDAYNAAPGEPRRIMLQENFRSRPDVLNAANIVFENIMSKRLGEIDYDQNARLKPGAEFPAGNYPAELLILRMPESTGEDEECPKKTALEADMVAGQINHLVDSGAQTYENGIMRPIGYGDIAVLLRSPGSSGAAYRRALEMRGIPVLSEQGGGYFSSLEVSSMISFLAVIDNPHQDIPLISALRSPLFGFESDELGRIRAGRKEGDFFDALTAAKKNDTKTGRFLDLLEELRDMSADMPSYELLWNIYNKTDIMARLSAMEGGGARRENLMLLFEYAREFEESGYRGLFRFTAWLRRLMERGEEPRLGRSASGGSVRIMSIHKSKGLEFPVVFLSDTARRFNKQDLTEGVLVHPELGLGPKVTDSERGIEYPTTARIAITKRLLRENLSEEMRILYVAMTRARERLFITCSFKKPDEVISKMMRSLASPMPPLVLENLTSPAHWIIGAALLDKDCAIRLSEVLPEESTQDADKNDACVKDGESPAWVFTPEEYLKIESRLNYRYPYLYAADLPSKITATELKGRFSDADMASDASRLGALEMQFEFSLPELGEKADAVLTGAEKGAAVHKVLQYVDLHKTGSAEDIKEEITRLVAAGRLSRLQANAVDAGFVYAFFSSPLGRRIISADNVMRELRFSLLCPAEAFFDVPSGEEILLQGVVDCCIEEQGELTIIDYKTDYVNDKTIADRARLYEGQLAAYAGAMSRIMKKEVRKAVIYFMRAQQAVEVPLK